MRKIELPKRDLNYMAAQRAVMGGSPNFICVDVCPNPRVWHGVGERGYVALVGGVGFVCLAKITPHRVGAWVVDGAEPGCTVRQLVHPDTGQQVAFRDFDAAGRELSGFLDSAALPGVWAWDPAPQTAPACRWQPRRLGGEWAGTIFDLTDRPGAWSITSRGVLGYTVKQGRKDILTFDDLESAMRYGEEKADAEAHAAAKRAAAPVIAMHTKLTVASTGLREAVQRLAARLPTAVANHSPDCLADELTSVIRARRVYEAASGESGWGALTELFLDACGLAGARLGVIMAVIEGQQETFSAGRRVGPFMVGARAALAEMQALVVNGEHHA